MCSLIEYCIAQSHCGSRNDSKKIVLTVRTLFLCLTISADCVSIPFLLFCVHLALLFGGDTNPAHPKHIGSIDPTCNVADVVKGKDASPAALTVAEIALGFI